MEKAAVTLKFTERSIASYLARVIFERRHLMLVPNCKWSGNECDLLVVTANLRIIDVEIKISRADLKADAKKDKWFHNWNWKIDGPYNSGPRRPRQWPSRVWKHYYCLPRAIWKPELYDSMNPVSGLLLIQDRDDGIKVTVERRAKPDTKADRITAENAIDIARLASLRMWDAYETLDKHIAWAKGEAA
jgi:hypothetical protein